MRVLVASASKHGSTAEIARTIGASLTFRQIEADVRPAESVTSLEGYDGVILGSGVYMGHWLEPAKRFIQQHTEDLLRRPVWLFSSGPLGDPAKPGEDPADAAALVEATRALEHRVFPGSLWKEDLGIAERAMVAAVRAPEGDFRPWAEIDDWAGQIAAQLATSIRSATPV
jgi:menaquinone-dependent protoporphyrinogen oxidase